MRLGPRTSGNRRAGRRCLHGRAAQLGCGRSRQFPDRPFGPGSLHIREHRVKVVREIVELSCTALNQRLVFRERNKVCLHLAVTRDCDPLPSDRRVKNRPEVVLGL